MVSGGQFLNCLQRFGRVFAAFPDEEIKDRSNVPTGVLSFMRAACAQ